MNYGRKLRKMVLIELIVIFAVSLVDFAVAQTWIPLRTSGSPPDMYSEEVANYDVDNNRLIVYFPGNPAVPPGRTTQVWVLTNANGLGGTPVWTRLQPAGTPPSSNGGQSVVYDAAANRLIIYGGCFGNCSPALADVFVLSNANGIGGTPVWSQTVITNPQARVPHGAVYDATSDRMITFGGDLAFYGTCQNDTRVLPNPSESPATWITLTTSGGLPGIRTAHSSVYDADSNRMVIFGGTNLLPTHEDSDYNDVWVLSNANGLDGVPTWVQLSPQGTPPPQRGGHSAVYDPINNRMLVFGGGSFQNPQDVKILGDLWQLTNANGLDPDPPTWSQIGQFGTPPGARRVHGAAFDANNQRMIIFGGEEGQDRRGNNRVSVLDLSSQ